MNFYWLLGVSKNASSEEITKAYKRKKNEYYQKTNESKEIEKLDEAFNVLIDGKKRKRYDRFLKKKRQKRNKTITITAAGLAVVVGIGYCIVKDSKVKGYIKDLPEDLKIGTFCKKNDKVTNSHMNKDFVLIEIPDYDEDVSENSHFVRNIAECLVNNEDFGIFLKTCARTEEEFKTIIYRFNSLSQKYNWFSAYPIIIDLEYQNEIDSENLSSIINSFNKLLKENGWFPEFCIRNENLKLSEDIKIVKISGNKELTNDEKDNYSTFTYGGSMLGRLFGDSDFNSSNISIFSKDYTNKIVEGNYNGYSNQQYYVGIDVSSYQEDINWDKVSNKIDFAICRICDFYGYDSTEKGFYDILDKTYSSKISNCIRCNIPFSSYYLTRANTREKATNEANAIVKFLKAKGLVGSRIYLDIESYNNSAVAELIKNNDSKIIEIILTAKNIIEEAGFEFGLYTNNNDLIHISKSGVLDDIPLWIARYGNDMEFNINSNIDSMGCLKSYIASRVNNPTSCHVYIQQITQNGIVDGVGNSDGKVDINLIPVSNGLDSFVGNKSKIKVKQ